MLKISTNIFKKISEEEKKDIQNLGKDFGSISVHDYSEKGIGLEEVIKVIFQGFALKGIIENTVLWGSLKELIGLIFNISVKKFDKPVEVQVWISDASNLAALNVVFSIKKESEIHDLFTALRIKLNEDVFSKGKEQEKGKIFWIAFDKENEDWLVKVL